MLHTYPSTYSTCILFDLITSTIQGIFCVQYKLTAFVAKYHKQTKKQ